MLLNDFVDLDLGKFLTVAVQFLEALAADLLENENLVSPCIVIEHCCLHNCTFEIRSSYPYVIVAADEKDLSELHGFTFGLRKPLNKEFITSLNFKLLACDVYNCVHLYKTLLSFNRKRLILNQLFFNGLTVMIHFKDCKFRSFIPIRKILFHKSTRP